MNELQDGSLSIVMPRAPPVDSVKTTNGRQFIEQTAVQGCRVENEAGRRCSRLAHRDSSEELL